MSGAPSPNGGEGPAIQAEDLVRDFGPVRAVDEVTFALPRGRVLAIFGPNGAGKTTLLRMLAGTLRPSRGGVRVAGERLDPGAPRTRAPIGILSHRTFLYDLLSARENLDFHARLHGLDRRGERVSAGLDQVGLSAHADRRVGEFSRGMRQRLSLARTLLHEPEIVLLDEPYAGLDVHGAELLQGILAEVRDGRRTAILVTHDLTRGLALADEVAIQVNGRFVAWYERSGLDLASFERLYRGHVEAGGGGG